MLSLTEPSQADINAISLTGRMLGALLYYSPEQQEVASVIDLLSNDNWVNEWPCGTTAEIQQAAALIHAGFMSENRGLLSEEFQRLFIGPDSLPAPPWGSVYLDRECVIFGESTLALRHWQSAVLGIEVQQQQREPEDHIGLLLMFAAWLAENQPEQIVTLLSEHLLPWSGRFIALLEEKSVHPFYQGIAQLTRITLNDWQNRLNPIVVTKELFF